MLSSFAHIAPYFAAIALANSVPQPDTQPAMLCEQFAQVMKVSLSPNARCEIDSENGMKFIRITSTEDGNLRMDGAFINSEGEIVGRATLTVRDGARPVSEGRLQLARR